MGNDIVSYFGYRVRGCIGAGNVRETEVLTPNEVNWRNLNYHYFIRKFNGVTSHIYVNIGNRVFTISDLLPRANRNHRFPQVLVIEEMMNNGQTRRCLRGNRNENNEINIHLEFRILCEVLSILIFYCENNRMLIREYPNFNFERYISEACKSIGRAGYGTIRISQVLYLLGWDFTNNRAINIPSRYVQARNLSETCFCYNKYEKAMEYRQICINIRQELAAQEQRLVNENINGWFNEIINGMENLFLRILREPNFETLEGVSQNCQHFAKFARSVQLISQGNYRRAIILLNQLIRDRDSGGTIIMKSHIKKAICMQQMENWDGRNRECGVVLRKIVSPIGSTLFTDHRNVLPILLSEFFNLLRDACNHDKYANFLYSRDRNLLHLIFDLRIIPRHAVTFVRMLADLDAIELDGVNNRNETPLQVACRNRNNDSQTKYELMALLISYQDLEENDVLFIPVIMRREIERLMRNFRRTLTDLNFRSIGTEIAIRREIQRIQTLVGNLKDRCRRIPELHIIFHALFDLAAKTRIPIILDPNNRNVALLNMGNIERRINTVGTFLYENHDENIPEPEINLGTRRNDEALISTLVHEICHFVTHLVKKNSSKPYNNLLEERIYLPIINEMRNNFRNDRNSVNIVFHSVFLNYLERQHPCEILAKVCQFVMFDRNGLRIMKTQYKKLWDFIFYQWIPDLRDYVFRIDGVHPNF